jgi:hypothetical protein
MAKGRYMGLDGMEGREYGKKRKMKDRGREDIVKDGAP